MTAPRRRARRAGAEHQRQPGERREHEPGQHRVRERLRGVGVAQVQQPDAERAARRAEHDDLGERALQQPESRISISAVVVVLDGDGAVAASSITISAP